jgi:hypothetical protein
MTKKLRAEIIFTSPQEGGYSRTPQSGIRPQLAVGDVLTSCIVRSTDGSESFEIGKTLEVELELPFWSEYRDKFYEGMGVVLHDGSRVVARGKFIDPFNECLPSK